MTPTTLVRERIWSQLEVPERRDEAYLDFVTSLRLYNRRQVRGALERAYQAAAGEFEARNGRSPRTLDDAKEMLERLPVARWFKRIGRSTQEMNWAGVLASTREYAAEIERDLADAEMRGPGRLILDPTLEYPEYYASSQFHIQPGSYQGHPLSAFVYYFGARVFRRGQDTGTDGQRVSSVNGALVPADGRVERVLDLGCSVGTSVLAWKQRFPEAEVWGIDLSAPMVRYAHKLAVDQGVDANFAQMAAEHLKFPDNHFDAVYAIALFHEVPVAVGRRIIAEAYRVLRPGGVFTIVDFASAVWWSAFDAYIRDWDATDNEEPFAIHFCHSDLLGALTGAGFKNVVEQPHAGVGGVRSGEK